MKLDHVIVAVADLVGDSAALERAHGLTSFAGGRHPGWGTANRIVPLGDSYIELIAVVDEHEAHESVLGDRVATSAAAGGGPMGWAVRPLDLDATAARLGLGIGRGSRTTLSGERIEWRSAGLDEAMRRPWLPFFIDWGDTASFPGAIAEPVASITRLELEGDVQELSTWLGDHSLPLEPRAGTAGVTSIVLDGPRGPVQLARTGR